MKKFITDARGTCWRDAIGCILEIRPAKVPDFLKLYNDNYIDETRKWLKEKLNKSIIFVPANVFMETGVMKLNPPVGPSGFSIGLMNMIGEGNNHAVDCKDGMVYYDNGQERSLEYNHLEGYFLIYDLEEDK